MPSATMDEQTFTQDLRSNAREFNRDKNSRTKWALGQGFGPGRREEDARPRPARIAAFPKTQCGTMKAHSALHKDIAYASGESSAEEEIDDPSTAPAPDAEIAYSFDAARGPSHGSQILGNALDKAVERFEIKETDKLIKNEYEVLDAEGEPVSPLHKKRNVALEDADYEFVDA